MTANVKKSWKQFLVMFGAGAVGIVALMPSAVELIRQQLERLGEVPPAPWVLFLAALLQPLVLLAVSVAAGLRLAPKLGLRSHLAEWAGGEDPAPGRLVESAALSVAIGVAVAIVLLLVDRVTLPLLGPDGASLSLTENRTLVWTVAGVLYGGITEELLIRWGLMSLLASAFAALLKGRAMPTVMWAAIIISALLFGAGHLPALIAQGIEPSFPVVARTIVLNTIAGIGFGWLFWRRSLEAAMISHATVHVTWSLAALFL